MHRLNELEKLFTAGASVLVTIISYILSDHYLIDENTFVRAVFVVLSIVFGYAAYNLSNSTLRYFYKYSVFRSFMLGDKNIEGYWFMRTYKEDNDLGEETEFEKYQTNIINNIAITAIEFDVQSKEFIATGTRIIKRVNDGEEMEVFTTISEFCHVRTTGPRSRYINYFDMRISGEKNISGYAYGVTFKTKPGDKRPTRFDAEISLKESRISYHQRGEYISPKAISYYSNLYGNYWMRFYLSDMMRNYKNLGSEDVEQYQFRQKNIRNMLDGNIRDMKTSNTPRKENGGYVNGDGI